MSLLLMIIKILPNITIKVFINQSMKKPLQLKENRYLNKIKNTQIDRQAQKELKVYLPPIKLPTQQQVQKTLYLLVKKMQGFVSNYPGQISSIITRCLTALYEHMPEESLQFSQVSPLFKQHSKDSIRNLKSLENWGVKSQILNVKRGDLKKVESRKLFDKVRQAKYDEVQLKNDKQIIDSLKRKIAEKDQGYKNINKKVEQLKQRRQQQQKKIQTYSQKINTLEKKNKSLQSLNKQLSHKMKQLQHQSLRLKVNSQFKIKSIKEKNEQLLHSLKQREQEITSLWQSYLSNDKIYLF